VHSASWQDLDPPWRGKWRMQEIKNELELLADALRRTAEDLAACRKAATGPSGGVDALVSAAAKHLADLDPQALPLVAQTMWTDHVARALKADGTKPLSAHGVAGLRSWPAARLKPFVRALGEIERIVREAEIEARNEIVRATISREYS